MDRSLERLDESAARRHATYGITFRYFSDFGCARRESRQTIAAT
jgi:hypothetical protein